MDKKSRYNTPPSGNKGTATDSKKSQDVANGKVFPKTSKKRESTGANGYSKNEQPRKSSVQKTRSFDKRPKPKGQYYGCPKENTKVDYNEIAEVGSVMTPGSKKQNLNHLLNFHYEPRENRSSYGKSSKNYNNSNRWLPPVQRHKYNKELYLQANCQFVVNRNGNYSIHLIDPDTLVNWELIEQIKVQTSENLSCPICLSFPTAGRMTRCGHVYCWPCILHYLSLSDKSWRKCPICDESVHKSDLKSVAQVTQNSMNVGDTIKLRLMRRKRGSLLAIPVGENETSDPETFFSVSQHSSNQIYSKLLLADYHDILEIIKLDKLQLEIELMDDPHSSESCFIEQALNELAVREENVLKQLFQGHKEKNVTDVEKVIDIEKKEIIDLKEISENQEKEQLIEDTIAFENTKDIDQVSNHSQSSQNLSKFFYFYQAEDGQHIYLHAMNVKMLELQYGNLEHCPHFIEGKLVERESGSFTEDLRKRMRYLCHLPLTCPFDVVEIELKTPLISSEVLNIFSDQLEVRKNRRNRRERDEKKREKKITAEENKRMGRYPTPNVHIGSHKHFPEWHPESQSSSISIPSPPESIATSSVASSPIHNSFEDDTILTQQFSSESIQCEPGPSFAQMLRSEGCKITSSSTRSSIDTHGPLKNLEIENFQRKVVVSNEDDYTDMTIQNQSLGDVLAQALKQSEMLETAVGNTEFGSRKTKKKKRGKPTVLFTSGMNRNS
ncbi:RING finger protein 10 [Microplitis mediator]|uniref:RING finger protein 10 n=1 Tax=Microplitis mediator TaxID=375433 RepID=UPI0025561516|nr:RING finger protein 10 [Microplitis mediator]